jgi:hypothetical protein
MNGFMAWSDDEQAFWLRQSKSNFQDAERFRLGRTIGGRELSQLAARGSPLTAGIAGRLLFADVLRLETSRNPNAALETGGQVRVARPTLFCHAKAISVD